MRSIVVGLVLLLGSLALQLKEARACGCFAPPDVSQPLLQAGEEIVFVVENGQITMHVKLRYSGRAGDFGWLLPLPSVPVNSKGVQGIDVGTDELFSQLEARTQPTYVVQRQPCPSGGPSIGCGAGDASPAFFDEERGAMNASPLVKQGTVGPYDFAILKANDKSEMLKWLSDFHYVVPAGTDTAIDAYIHPGAYLLALRLTAGATTGDLQPVVLSYPGDLPMVPITLTAVGATPNMGILIWVLGYARAIPRNYAHAVINDMQLDWLNQVKNYNEVVTRAVSEAPGKHAFVTEYAGRAVDVMARVLDEDQRFAGLPALMTQRDPVLFVLSLLPQETTDRSLTGFGPSNTRVRRGFALNGQFFAVVGAQIPVPQQLLAEGVTPADYYTGIDNYLRTDRAKRPAAYADIEAKLAAFDPAALVAELDSRIVQPTLRAGALFSSSQSLRKLTRLYTTLSPEDMNSDPVFSFNPSLPDVSNLHRAVFSPSCISNSGKDTLSIQEGSHHSVTYTEAEANNQSPHTPFHLPYSERIEALRESGEPMILVDNSQAIRDLVYGEPARACTASPPRRASGAPYLALCALAITGLLLRRRARPHS